MHSPSKSRSSELTTTLGAHHIELVRGFIREAALAEDVPTACASQIAADGADAWDLLCAEATPDERAHVSVVLSGQDVRARFVLHGHARFSRSAALFGGRLRPGTGFSCHDVGIDSCELVLHRNVTAGIDPHFALPQEEAAPAIATRADDLEIVLAEKSDTAAIARCFLEVYGRHYIHSDVYSPQRYWKKVENGELLPVVVRDAKGEVIGHLALEREPGSMVAERGEAVVLPSYRGHRLMERMSERLAEEAPKQGLHGVYSEALTIHTFSQRNDERTGMTICAALLGANPESFRPKDVPCPTAGQRQSYIRTFNFVQKPAARTLQPVGPYVDVIRTMYENMGVDVAVAGESSARAQDSTTRLKVNDRGYGVIRFEQVGSNCAIELAQALRDVRSLGARSVQLSARIADPGLPRLVAAARDLGFFFCGLGPAFAGGDDLLLLQLLTEPLDTGKLQIYSDVTRQLIDFIDADRRAR